MLRIAERGAVGDGKHLNTAVLQACIDEASRTGDTVLVEGGVYLCGTLYLKSNVTLEIAAGATLLASPDIRDYGCDTHHNRYRNEPDMDRCWLYAQDQENIRICGMGVIDGNAEAFPNAGSIYRPMMMRFLRCRHLRLENLRLYDAAAWTTAFLDSSYIHVRDVVIRNAKRYNGDGLDFDGCAHVYVDGCSITGTDDNLCLQASSQAWPVHDVHISNCRFTSLCAGIRIGLKSIGDIRDVTITGCTMENVWREGIKVECTEGGAIEDILVSGVTMRNVSRPIFCLLNNRFLPDDLGSSVELDHMPQIGRMQRLIFRDVTCVDTEEMAKAHRRFDNDLMGAPWFNGVRIDAAQEHPIRNLTIEHFTYVTWGGVNRAQIPAEYPSVLDLLLHPGAKTAENYYPDWSRASHMDIRQVDGLTLSGVTLETRNPDEREPVIIEHCTIRRQDVSLPR